MDLFLLRSCTPQDCIAKSVNARTKNFELISTSLGPGTYYIVVDGWGWAASTFNLKLDCVDDNGMIDCNSVIPISCGMSITGNTATASNNNDGPYCNKYSGYSGPEQVFEFSLDIKTKVSIIASDLTGDLDMFLLDSCARTQCIGASGKGGTNTEGITKTLLPGTYYIVLDGYQDASSKYKLSLHCQAIEEIDCNSAITTFYSGDGSNLQFAHKFNGGINADFQHWSIGNRIISRSANVHLVFQQAGTYNVCATYIDKATGQTVKCCKTTCISLPTTCEDAIQYEYVDGHFELSIEGANIDLSSIVWRNDTDGLEIDPNNVPASCRKILVSVRYYDTSSDCWILCCKYITFCPPSSCQEDITASYDPANRKYTFNFNNAGASKVLWRFDDTKEILQNGMFTLPDDWSCQDRLVTVYYFDTISKSWKVCCKTIHLCPPTTCDDAINYDFDIATNTFTFSLDQSQAVDADWRFVETDQVLEAGQFTLPDNWECQALTVEASYFDPATQSWNICTRVFDICPPDECAEAISFDYDANTNTYTFNLDIAGAENLFWRIDEDKVWLQDGVFQLPAGWVCQEKTITVFYFDTVNEVWKVCCKRIYLCPPSDCEDAINYTYDPIENAFQFTLSITNEDAFWFFEESNEAIPNGKFNVPDGWNCSILTVQVLYYDPATDCYRLCSKKVNICPPDDCEDAITYTYDAANNALVFNLELDGITETVWKFDEDDSAIPNGIFTFPTDWVCMNKTVSVFYFDPAEDCWKLCSKRITICPPDDCGDNISYEYLPDENAFQFTLDIAGATQTFWKFDNEDYSVPNGKFVLPDNWTCTDLTISVFYFNTETECYVICSKDISICPPTDCSENVLYTYDEADNKFTFELDIDGTDEVLWIFDDTKEPIQNGEFFIPDDWACQVKLVSAYYFDNNTNTWKVCCRPIYICPPTDCKESISFSYDESGYNAIFSFADIDSVIQGFSWEVKETGQMLGNDPSASTELAVPDSCQEITIVARYEIDAVWFYCEKRVYLCNPNECVGLIMSEFNNNQLTLSVDPTLEEVNWFDTDGNFLGSGNEITIDVESVGVISVMVFFKDESTDCYASCNEDIEITCSLPNAGFTYTEIGVGFQFTNTSDTGTTFEWDFDEGLIVDTADMPTVIFPTGTHDVCIKVTNDCGEKIYCEQLVVNNKSTVTFDIPDNVCGNAGDLLNVPVTVTNFNDILSFKFTIRSTDQQKARIMGIKVEDETINNGHNYHTEDDQVRFFWSNASGKTLNDATQVFNIQVELMEETDNPVVFEFTDDPVAAEAFNSNMDIIPLLFQTGSVCADAKPLFADVSGSIIRAGNNDPINLARVEADGVGGTGSMSATDGSYRLSPLNVGESYSIVPFKNDDVTNGINALDIVLIQRHILQVNAFNAPFTFIAADVNNDKIINALDVVNLQRLQLRSISTFPNNTSWRFIPTNYAFMNENPLEEGFPEQRRIDILNDNRFDEDFLMQ